MQGEFGHSSGMVGRPPISREGSELDQYVFSLRDRTGRRRSEPRQFGRIMSAPLRKIEHQRREIRIENFRWTAGSKHSLFFLGPQSVTQARFKSAGPAPALFRRISRNTNRVQS